ncbi:MAG: YraN family protein [Sediminibacterium sp.]|jgi:putative endonuclease|nr:YraN family protein [Hydrotalea sp.]MCU0337830.1 YraN family protein [Sediminibacterium sp.]
MSRNKDTGKQGEEIAIAHLLQNGFSIAEKNWRWKRKEADIIAIKGNTIHLVEVKTRNQLTSGLPEESITQTKMNHLIELAEAYWQLHPAFTAIQIDVIAIILHKGSLHELKVFEDVFF